MKTGAFFAQKWRIIHDERKTIYIDINTIGESSLFAC